MQEVKRLLIYRCGAIGDTVVALPAIHAIRQHFENASMVLMTASNEDGVVWADRILRDWGLFDDFVTYGSEELRSPSRLWALIRRIRALRVDLVVHLTSDLNSLWRVHRDRLFFSLAGVRRFIACHSSKLTLWGRVRRADRIYPTEVDRLMNGLHRWGIEGERGRFDFPIAESHLRRVLQLLEEAGLEASHPLIGICPGAKQPANVWPVERYREICRRIYNETDANIAIVGGPAEGELGKTVCFGLPAHRWVNASGQLSVIETGELLRRCLFYLGNDTGPMHIAAAVGTRCLVVFGARGHARSWHPYGENHILLRKHVPCQNCYLSVCVKENIRCLKATEVEEVWSACQRMMFYR